MWSETLSSRGDAGTCVVPSAEVEDGNRVHHLVLMEDFDAFADLARDLSPFAPALGSTGRPRIPLGGGEIARAVHRRGGLIGPAHAFTPWTSLYASHDSTGECYGDEPADFLELGLSADSSYGAAIPHLSGIPFVSSSDAHGPDTWRLGREFVDLSVREETPAGVLEAIRRGSVVRNVGFFPEEGKYNRTACSRCYRQFELEEATALSWRCPGCGGRIKKGVRDRARELSAGTPGPRPPYLHMIPSPRSWHVCSRSRLPGRGRSLPYMSGSSQPSETRSPYSRMSLSLGSPRSTGTLPPRSMHSDPAGCASPRGGGRYGSFSFY